MLMTAEPYPLVALACLLSLAVPVRQAPAAPPSNDLVLVGRLAGSSGSYVHFSPDGSMLLTTGGDGARIWEVMKHHADADGKDIHGKTPLDMAKRGRHIDKDMIEVLSNAP